jgi:hypothetical protein
MKQEQSFQNLCNAIVNLDSSIRFVGIADNHGNLMATAERKGLKPLLNQEERAQYAITAATRQQTRLKWESVLGSISYACAYYDKVIRGTIPIKNRDNRLGNVLLFSFDAGTNNYHDIITEKMLPLLAKFTGQARATKR